MRGHSAPALLLMACFFLASALTPVGQRAATRRPAALRFIHLSNPSATPSPLSLSGRVEVPPVAQAAMPDSTARVTHVVILPGVDGGTIVDVGTTGPVEFKPFRLKNPMCPRNQLKW